MKSAVRIVAIIWSAMAGGAGLVFINQVLLARTLPVADFGKFTTVLSLLNTLAPLAGVGVGGYWLRVHGRGKSFTAALVHSSRMLIVVTSLAIFLACYVVAMYSWDDSDYRLLCLLLAPIIAMQAIATVATSVAQTRGEFRSLAFIQVVPHIGRLLSTLIGAALLSSLWITSAGYAVTATAFTLLMIIYVRQHIPLPSVPSTRRRHHVVRLAYEASPYAINQFLNLVILQGGIYVVAVTLGATHAAQYAVCTSILLFIYILPNAIFNQYLLPRLHRLANSDRGGLLEIYRVGNTLMLIGGLGIGTGVYLTGGFAISIMFGAKYAEATDMIGLLAWAIPLRFLATSIGAILITSRAIQKKILYMAAAAIFQVVLTVLLTPHLGLTAIGIAVICGELALVALYLWGAYIHCFGRDALRGWPSGMHLTVIIQRMRGEAS